MMRKIFLLLLLLVIICIMFCSCFSSIQNLSELYRRNVPAVVTICTNDEFESYGSGFVINKQKGLIITAAHVIKKRISFTIKFWSNFETLGIVQSIDYENDIAIIKVDPKFLSDNSIPNLKLEINPTIGKPVFCIGTPDGFSYTVSFGILSRNLTYVDYLWTKFPLGFYISDIHVSDGSSGCPVFNLENELIGMVVGYVGHRLYTVIVPAASIEKFMKDNEYTN